MAAWRASSTASIQALKNMPALFMSPQLTTSKALLFHQDGCSVIKPDAGFQNPATVAEWITAADRLVTKSAGPTTPATLIMS